MGDLIGDLVGLVVGLLVAVGVGLLTGDFDGTGVVATDGITTMSILNVGSVGSFRNSMSRCCRSIFMTS